MNFQNQKFITISTLSLVFDVNITEEPYARKSQVRFCEGHRASHDLRIKY